MIKTVTPSDDLVLDDRDNQRHARRAAARSIMWGGLGSSFFQQRAWVEGVRAAAILR